MLPKIKSFFFVLSLLIIFAFKSDDEKLPKEVLCEHGNIVLVYKDNHKTTLTSTGIDTLPVLTPDKKMVCFIRIKNKGTREPLQIGVDEEIIKIDLGTLKESRVVKTKENNNMEHSFGSFSEINFSPDSRFIYFMTTAWMTSDAIHRYDLQTGAEKFISDGNSLDVIPRGKYAGFIITTKHKYHKSGGAYDYYYLLTHDGKEVMKIGDDEKSVEKFIADNQ